MEKKKLIAIVGTNASGKSSLAIKLAKLFNGEIVSADSRQIYKHLDLGTGKVTKQEQAEVKHHLLDVADLNEKFSLADFQRLAYHAIDDILIRNKTPFLTGGTGLYTRSVVEGYNLTEAPPNYELRKQLESKTKEELISMLSEKGVTDFNDSVSTRQLIRKLEKIENGVFSENESLPKYEVLQIGLTWDKEILHKRIKDRIDIRIEQGMIEEVKNIKEMGATDEFLESLGLEYRFINRYLNGLLLYEEFKEMLYKETCQFAKRQMTWLRKEKNIIWLDTKEDYLHQASKLVKEFLK